ncbi:UNVERIFIED_CONTAM: hypothetical protein Sradi_6956900 [Sesamum radiatum]|uniref:DUF4283 domain-containing protein n=1 Tax=Sesamum radiatum TaxID=300843 RepID=A0AAW2JGT8_SESRA
MAHYSCGLFSGTTALFPAAGILCSSELEGVTACVCDIQWLLFLPFSVQICYGRGHRRWSLLFQGQPIVLQAWEQGMSLRRQTHTQIPVWIRLRHLPMEYWTEDGLSTVASGIGTPLYADSITKNCARLDYARVCVMLNFNSELPKHLVVISPVLRNGKEDPKRVDVEYEWLPQKCTTCCSLGHLPPTCPANAKKNLAPPITIFVKKQAAKSDPVQPVHGNELAEPVAKLVCKNNGPAPDKGKEIILYNSYGALDTEGNDSQLAGPNYRSPTVNSS